MIRRATLEDAAAIAAIHVRTWQAAYAGIVPDDFLAGLSKEKRKEFWGRELADNQSIVVTAVEKGAVVGWASGGASRDPDAAKCVSEVYAIYISPENWAQGVGTQLMRRIEEEISPCSVITLWVLAQNQRAIAFYRKLGYAPDGAEKIVQLGGISLSEVRFRKKTSTGGSEAQEA